jgi:uncharacterized repeat protein (TIGR02543 family)
LIVLLALAVAVFLHACQENARQPTEPQFATGGNRLLTITGGGTGSGTVTAPAAGGQPALSCTITAGVAARTGCTQSYPWRTVVTLTATPSSGHTFTGWTGACTRPGTCTVTMGVVRNVTASFAAPTPFSLTVTGGGAGDGAVTSQQGLSPAIGCTVTAGQAAATGCAPRIRTGPP